MAIYKRGRGFELGTTENKSRKWPERDLEPGSTRWRVRRADHSATIPPNLIPSNRIMQFMATLSFGNGVQGGSL